MKKKILKTILIILAIILIIFLIHTIRNYIIISKLQNKFSKYDESTNYHTKYISANKNGETITIDCYKKDNKEAICIERNDNGKIVKLLRYNNGERIDSFIEEENSKIARLDVSDTVFAMGVYNYFNFENNWHKFLYSPFIFFKTVEHNGKQCYKVNNIMFSSSTYIINNEEIKAYAYIEKETGLFLGIENSIVGPIFEYEYEFDNVDASIFIEPDISKYTLQKDN